MDTEKGEDEEEAKEGIMKKPVFIKKRDRKSIIKSDNKNHNK